MTKIAELFERDIDRPINGVVKADQLDAESIWQELDEFVVTRELDQHLRRFFSSYLESIDRPNDPDIGGKIGVWVSGFFGSGKSHFIKVLSHLLRNGEHKKGSEKRKAVEFFEPKIKDAMLLGDVKRAVASDTDVLLFNIDSKAEHKPGRDAILTVFLKVLNEMQGYSGDHPHIAHLERHLASKNKLETFHAAFREKTGTEWAKERDAYAFNRDEVVYAFSKALNQSKEGAEKWIDSAESNFPLTIENFSKWVKEYLDSKGPTQRLIFLVDEVGQFIGTDAQLMLNLQTITENLGTVCGGRAWVVVTSQEDIDAVLGEMAARGNDFSKIQGRFKTRLSLSSANVDEVIQQRLLAKRPEVKEPLQTLYSKKGDILKNQLSFSNVGMTLKPFKDSDDFLKNYPFIPYQFQLVQKIFEVIRRAGATGLHLAKGERSLLDAFQSAAKEVSGKEIGILVPLYRFYPSIESFLDTSVKRTIEQAKDNTSLQAFDIKILEVLFLIRYVDEIKGNADNLVTLCLDDIDTDRVALRRQIEESLQRLEKETLINRNGDNYVFLTNEERDINREIKHVAMSSGDEAKLLGELIFDDILQGQRKLRYSKNGMDFLFTRMCDLHPVGNRVEGGLLVSVITPLSDDYATFGHSKCLLTSSQDDGHVLVIMADEEKLSREVQQYIRTERFIRAKHDGTLAPGTVKIVRDLADENRQRRERLIASIGRLQTEAKYYVAGNQIEPKALGPITALEQALNYLIDNTFNRMGLLKNLRADDFERKAEIQAVLRANDIAQLQLDLKLEENNPQALIELRNYLLLSASANRSVVLNDLIENKFATRPYGWPQFETVLLIARLVVLGEINLVTNGAATTLDKVYEEIITPNKWRRITIVQKKSTDPKALQAVRNLGKEIFAEMGPDGEDALVEFLKSRLRVWQTRLNSYKPLADTGTYPGKTEIADGLRHTAILLGQEESAKFIEKFGELKDDLRDFRNDFHDLENFYGSQRPTWEKLRKAVERFELNRLELERDPQASAALKRMGEILKAPAPYALIKDGDELVRKVDEVNSKLVAKERQYSLTEVDKQVAMVAREAAAIYGDDIVKAAECMKPLQRLRSDLERQESLAHMAQASQEAERLASSMFVEFGRIAAATPPSSPPQGSRPIADPVPKFRIVRSIKVADLLPADKHFIENIEDVNAVLGKLRQQMEDAISKNERIQLK